MSLIIRSAITVVLFSSFIALWVWAWRRENAAGFSAAASQPLLDDTASLDSVASSSKPTP